MNPIKITAKNFLSFKELEYDFISRPVLILGDNRDDDGQESNGACKSGIFNILELCLLGDVSRDQNAAELVNFDADLLETSLLINCPIRKETMFIERRIHKTKGGSSQLSINGAEKYKFEDKMVSEINSFILEWLSVTKKDLQSYFIVNGENSKPLFKASNTEVIDMIGRFSNSNLINGVDKLVLSDCTDIEAKITELNQNKANLNGQITVWTNEIENESEEEFLKENKQKIEDKKEEIEEVKKAIQSVKDDNKSINLSIEEDTKKIESVSGSVKELEIKIGELKKVSFEKKYEKVDASIVESSLKIEEREKESKKVKDQIKEANTILDEIEKNIKGAVSCPKCSHNFLISDPEVDIEEEKKELPKVSSIILKLKEKLTLSEDSIKSIYSEVDAFSLQKKEIRKEEQEHLDVIKELNKRLSTIEEGIDDLNSSVKRNQNKLKTNQEKEVNLTAKIELINEAIELLKQSKFESNKLKWQKEIVRLNNQIIEVDEQVKEQEKKLFDKKQWIFNFKKFNSHLANKSLKVIEGYVNKFLVDLGSDIAVRIEGYKMKSDGTMSEKITPYIIRNGIVRKYGSFSKGERGRVNMACYLALAEVINKTHKYGGLDFIALDEATDGLDEVGTGLIAKSLCKLNKTILMTTHVTNRTAIHSDILVVKKENGVSTINY
jgi:exonuclease SbcC